MSIEDSRINFALIGKGITTMIIWDPCEKSPHEKRSYRFKNEKVNNEKPVVVVAQPAIEETPHPAVPVSPQKNVEIKLKLADDYVLHYPGYPKVA